MIYFMSFHEKQVKLETIPPRVTRATAARLWVPVDGVEANSLARLQVERPLKQEVSFDM